MLKAFFKKRKDKKCKEFAAKLKYGKGWRQKIYPHKYTSGTGPR